MKKEQENKLLAILEGLSNAATTMNDSILALTEIVRVLDERITRLEQSRSS